jgi:hypothetical protein
MHLYVHVNYAPPYGVRRSGVDFGNKLIYRRIHMTRYRWEEKEKHLENWRGSGKKAWVYAKENGIKP